MKLFKKTLLAAAVMASITVLAACGGNEDVIGVKEGSEKVARVDGSLVDGELSGADDAVLSRPEPTGEFTAKVATWHSLTDDASPMSKSLVASGLDLVAPAQLSGDMSKKVRAADGLVVNVDSAPDNWQQAAKSALRSGQTLVLISSGSGNALYDASMQLTGIGIGGANAIMILQGNPEDESFSLLPFKASEAQELADMMGNSYRRQNSAF
jgi:sarcosine oxidase gamma subunit